MRWLSGYLRSFVDIPMSDLVAGEGEPIVMMHGIPVGVSICYEAAFGEEIIRALPRAQLLVNVSNDAWFGDSLAPHQHLQIAQSRALEDRTLYAKSDEYGHIRHYRSRREGA